MLISELPEDIREIALQRQKECKDLCYDKNTDDLSWAFIWEVTPEGHDYWEHLNYDEIETQTDDQIVM